MQQMTDGTAASRPSGDTLETCARAQVRDFIQQLLEDEVTELLGREQSARRAPVDAPRGARNGHGKSRRLALMHGTITVRRPRGRDLEARFVSRRLPLFQRRTPEVAALLPELYLHGLALGDFELALRGLLGEGAPLSASSLVRLKARWQAQYASWQQRDLSDCRLVYLWADGVYVKAGLDTGKAAVLRDLKRRGLRAPKRTIADGHLGICLGIWSALAQIYPERAEQRGGNHKLRHVLDTVPRKSQAEVKAALQGIASADTEREATVLRDRFTRAYGRSHRRRWRGSRATGRGGWHTMPSRRNTGGICAPPIASSPPSRRSASAPRPRSASRSSSTRPP